MGNFYRSRRNFNFSICSGLNGKISYKYNQKETEILR